MEKKQTTVGSKAFILCGFVKHQWEMKRYEKVGWLVVSQRRLSVQTLLYRWMGFRTILGVWIFWLECMRPGRCHTIVLLAQTCQAVISLIL